MKTVLLLATIFCLATTTQLIETKTSLKIYGYVFSETGEPLAGAEVYLYNTKKGTLTDSLGYFELVVKAETEKISVSHLLHETAHIEIKKLPLNVVLKLGKLEPRVEDDTYSSLKRKSSSSIARPEAMMMESEMPVTDVAVAGYSDSERSSEVGMTMPKSMRDIEYKKEFKVLTEKAKERAGQLTAGEWNDLNNWEAWSELVEKADYKEMSEYWAIDVSDRISVFVTNQYELPVSDCLVTLRENEKIIWTAKTDNSGKAELWVDTSATHSTLQLEVRSRESRKVLKRVKTIEAGVNLVQLKEECDAPRNAEIMFVVDATGSMGDEIEFLKSELSDVIDQVEASRTDVSFQWGSVFYRDNSDDYLTRQSPLSSKSKRVLDFIDMQSAGGGGDYPEAVNEGLEEALMQEWSEDAIARIIFLVLDAPPHHDPEVLKDLQSQIAFASAMGIKIIPITASGINRQTEYLMKFMSIMTNGTYVFLTDHSGIGGKHLDPITKDYEVEKLNDLLIRVIGNYTDPGTCRRQEDTHPLFAKIEVYPNPTIAQLNVTIPDGVEKITLTTSSGMLITSVVIDDQEKITLDLSSYVDGMYVINFFADETIYSQKVVKSNKA